MQAIYYPGSDKLQCGSLEKGDIQAAMAGIIVAAAHNWRWILDELPWIWPGMRLKQNIKHQTPAYVQPPLARSGEVGLTAMTTVPKSCFDMLDSAKQVPSRRELHGIFKTTTQVKSSVLHFLV